MVTIQVDDDVWRYLTSQKDPGDSHNDVLRRELGLDESADQDRSSDEQRVVPDELPQTVDDEQAADAIDAAVARLRKRRRSPSSSKRSCLSTTAVMTRRRPSRRSRLATAIAAPGGAEWLSPVSKSIQRSRSRLEAAPSGARRGSGQPCCQSCERSKQRLWK